MKRLVRAFLSLVALAALVGISEAAAQGATLTVDPQLAKQGKSLFTSRGCLGCHSIGKGKRSGPDLAGVTERRSLDWLRRFMADPPGMMQTDSIAMALLEEHKGVKMPNLKLNDAQIEALLHYIKDESMKSSGGTR